MSESLISVTVNIDGHEYALDAIVDPDDVLFAVRVGRAVTDALVSHKRILREQSEE